ncbi:sensor histidine kinase [Actinoallomurus rhizosphaericola]|uniref:sensor histidine kinase n=1 Tax=Actinoallomurus rhizosphaericola TaxID=2952536 RepID=UPI00209025A2|nr:sensor histidine kinase [Actinoallomurus rhizosphaericola]MCO5992782.1 sensor histidine kinase [Actinoallomurus rhizosphaericola]
MDLTRLRRRMEAVPPWAGEAILCASVAAVTVYRIDTATPAAAYQSPDARAYGIGLAMAAALPVRRRSPALALSVVFLLWVVYHTANYPGGAPAVPVWVALFSVASARRRRAGLALGGALIVSDALARTKYSGVGLFDATLDGSTVVFIAALLLGDSVRSRRARRAEFEARLALLAAHRDQVAAQRLTEERMRIARELHDVSAHTIAVINVQASVAAELLTEAPDQAREALDAVRRAGGEAMAEMRATVGVLRERDGAEGGVAPPAPGIDRLPDLALACAGGGPRVEVRVEGERRPLPRLVEFTAYRIAQESLTNALRHSDADLVEILVRYDEAGLALEIRDDGGGGDDRAGETGWATEDDGRTGGPGGVTEGNGLRGMAERAAGLGGRLTSGPFVWPDGAGRGFRVRAWLPAVDDVTMRKRASRVGDRPRDEEAT